MWSVYSPLIKNYGKSEEYGASERLYRALYSPPPPPPSRPLPICLNDLRRFCVLLVKSDFLDTSKGSSHTWKAINLLYLSLTSDKQKAEESLGEINGDLFEVTAELKTVTEELEASKITKESLREELNELQETITGEKVNT